jgi:hypothetical protein
LNARSVNSSVRFLWSALAQLSGSIFFNPERQSKSCVVVLLECSEPAPAPGIESFDGMNRHAASGELNGRIDGEGSGGAGWSRRTKSNSLLNRSGMSLHVIVNLPHDAGDSRPVNSGVMLLT